MKLFLLAFSARRRSDCSRFSHALRMLCALSVTLRLRCRMRLAASSTMMSSLPMSDAAYASRRPALLQAGDQPVELGGRVEASEAPVEVGRGLSGFGGLVLFFHGVFLSVFRISVRA